MAPQNLIPNENREQNERQQHLQDVTDHIERKRHRRYRYGLIRRLLWLTVFIAGFMMLIFLLHDIMVRQQYESKMTEIAGLLRQYQQENRHLPGMNKLTELAANARNLALDKIEYEPQLVCEQSPPDTVLAHSPLCPLWLLAQRHMVVSLDFGVKWVSPEDLVRMLERRRQLFNQYEATQMK